MSRIRCSHCVQRQHVRYNFSNYPQYSLPSVWHLVFLFPRTPRASTLRGCEVMQVTTTMNGLSPNATMALIGPGILAVFGIAFVCAWSIEKKRPYLLLLALACGLFGLGACSQVLGWPGDAYLNAVVSGLLYTSAVVAAAEGVLLRARKQQIGNADRRRSTGETQVDGGGRASPRQAQAPSRTQGLLLTRRMLVATIVVLIRVVLRTLTRLGAPPSPVLPGNSQTNLDAI